MAGAIDGHQPCRVVRLLIVARESGTVRCIGLSADGLLVRETVMITLPKAVVEIVFFVEYNEKQCISRTDSLAV